MNKLQEKISKPQLEEAVKQSKTLTQILALLSLKIHKGNFDSLRQLAQEYQITLPQSKIGVRTTFPILEEDLKKAFKGSKNLKEIAKKLGLEPTPTQRKNIKEYLVIYNLKLDTYRKSYTNLLKEISETEFKEATLNSVSIKEVIDFLKMNVDAGSYKKVRYLSKYYGIDVPKAQGSQLIRFAQEANSKSRLSDEDFFQNKAYRSTGAIKIRLLRMGVLYLCVGEECPNPKPEWAGRSLTLQLDHINGDIFDNRKENLRFLCPNCHTQTETYGSKNRSGNTIKEEKVKTKKHASSGVSRKTKIDWPDLEEIIHQIELLGYSAYSKKLQVSDNGIRKHLIKKNVFPLPKFR